MMHTYMPAYIRVNMYGLQHMQQSLHTCKLWYCIHTWYKHCGDKLTHLVDKTFTFFLDTAPQNH